MGKLQNINRKINELRGILHELIEEKANLLDHEIILASKELDNALNEYNRLISEMHK
ncbi:aspartyl-phosphate phosphatase Spo0E family protein [Clostridium beijerinckii]|uniref:aspartyl-phosphate phosphatase Spo0E family protein n=1 Tax=Clostridium beijerinckii TaxID=1520 RepID=UPI00047B0233|nr:aspartyl-phosphate phosphatase Spo0E family protein [Clostridium beijerinckii]